MFRTIDLTTFILAPLLVGGIMSWFSPVAAAVFIASWNAVSLVAEYSILVMIFKVVPELAAPKAKRAEPSSSSLLGNKPGIVCQKCSTRR